MADKIRWGILGTGSIAHAFAGDLQYAQDAELVAVGSRSQNTADTFADAYAIPHRHPTYEALAADPDVDAIYISTPHPMHDENSLLCLDHGKAVLCEKPFTINAKQAKAVIDRARSKKLFLMEAMWTRFIPTIARVRELIDHGVLGEIRMVMADFGFRGEFNPQGRWLNLELGGGALLDVGIYPLALASMVLGTPTKIQSTAHLGETGADEQCAMLLTYPNGEIAALTCAVRTSTPMEALIIGTEGRIRIHVPFWKSKTFTLSRPDKEDEVVTFSFEGKGYQFEAMEVGNCLRAGKLESDVMPLDETLSLMETMDTMRAQWGLRYPGE